MPGWQSGDALRDVTGTGYEWLLPTPVPVIPAATSPWSGDWFGRGGQRGEVAAVTPVSIAVLPGGTVHTWGTVMSQARDLVDGTHPAWSSAAWQARERGRPTSVSVGHPDGRVEAFLVEADGTACLQRRPRRPAPARTPPDPCWGDPAEVRHDLCAVAAGPEHAEAVEQAADEAARAGDWDGAAHLFTVAAARRQAHGAAFTAEADRAVRLAVGAWLRTGARPASAALGFALVHLLISTFPDRPGPIAALLRRLADHLPAAAHPARPAAHRHDLP